MKKPLPISTHRIILIICLTATSVLAVLTLTAFTQDIKPSPDSAQRDSRLEWKTPREVTPGKEIDPPADPALIPFSPSVASNYSFSTATNASLTDMSSGTTQLVGADQDDTASSVVNIGFDFYFQGARFTQFSVNSNGLIRLGPTVVQGSTPYKPLAQAGLSLIAPVGSDQRTHVGDGKVHFKVSGAAPNRLLIVEWLNMQANFNSGGTSDLTYQARMYETTGVIEFVYGKASMSTLGAADVNSRDPNIGFSSSNTAGTVGSVTAPQSGTPAPTFDGASATAVANLYTAGTITVLDSSTNGSRRIFSFTPPTPTAPTSLTFTGVTASAMTLNWNDSPDELIYAIYRSTDGVNFSFFNTAVQNATSLNAIGLNPSTNYFWQVYGVSEGALSTALAGSQMTSAAGNIVSTGAGGNWSATATWVGGVVPTSTDNVTIVDGATVTIDVTTATCLGLTVGQGTSGILQYISTPASTLTVNGNATVAAGGTFTAGAGSLTTHLLNIGGSTSGSSAAGNLMVNGTFDMNTTAGVTTNFFGSSDGTVSGAGATCDFFAVVMQKGTSQTPVLDVTRMITMNAPAASGNRLSSTNGTFKLSSASVLTPWFGSQTLTATTGRIWVNNAGASTNVVGIGTGTGAGSPTVNGALQVDHGTFGYGSGNNTMTVGAAGSLTIGGADATVNMFGAVAFTAGGTFNMTAGNFNVNPQAANALGSTTNVVRFNTMTVNFTGGTLTIVNPHNAASTTGKELSISTSNSSLMNFQGGTIKFGDGVSSLAGSTDGFEFDTFVSTQQPFLGNVVVDNPVTNAATRFVKVNTALAPFQFLVGGNLTVTNSGGSAFRLNGNLTAVSGNVINNGTIDGTVASSRLYFLGNGMAQTYSGTGTSVAPLVSWDVDNALGVTLDPAVSSVVTSRIILFTGGITNSNKLTLGNGGATSGVVQIGNTTTPTAAGTLDMAPTFNLGTAGQTISYLRTTTARTTGVEINPMRTLTSMTYDDNDATHALTIAGGDLTINNIATALTMTNGRIITGANTLYLSSGTATVTRTNGYVDGNFKKSYAAAANKTFEVGTANGYSPVGVNVTAGTFPADVTVKAVQGPQPNMGDPTKALQRYWTLTGSGLTADLTFNYLDPTDIPVTANESNFSIFKYSGSFSMPGGTVDTMANTFTITGVSSFSDWTLAEPGAQCSYMLGSMSQNFVAAGGSNSVNVITPTGCGWTAVSNDAFITVNSGTPGSGNGTVGYSVANNTGPARMGTMTIAGITFTVTQDSGCSYMLSSMSQNFVAAGGSNSVNVITAMGCTWTAVSNDAFITVNSGTPGNGNGTVGYSVANNTGPARMGTMTIAGITFTVTQDAGCVFMLSSMSQNFSAAGGANSVNVITGTGCTWTAVSNDAFISVTLGTPGSGNGTVNYSVASNTGPARMGTMTIAGITFTVTQDGGCTFTLSRDHKSFPGQGGSGSVNVTASDPACPWTASTAATFIHITSGTPGTGNGTLQYTVDINPGPSIRSDTITIAENTYTVYQGVDFIDVPTNHLFYTEIGILAARGVTVLGKCGNGNYCPDDPVLREQMAAFIMRAKGEFNPPTPGMQRFTDVPPTNEFYNFIDRLAALNITVGCDPGHTMYCPNIAVPREQMAAFIMRGLGEFSPPTPPMQRFNDVPAANIFYNFIDRLAVLNITLGCTPNHLFYCPNDQVTRAQMAAFLVRAFDL